MKDQLTSTSSYKEIIAKMDKLSTAALCDAHSDVRVMEGGLHSFNRCP